MAQSPPNSTIMKGTSRCFSARRFLSISSVSTEPWQICAKNWTTTRCGDMWRNPKQHCWLSSTRYIDLNGETAGCTVTKQRHKADRDVRETSTKGTIPWRHEPKAGDQQIQRGITKITRRYEPNKSSNFARILQNFIVLIAIPFPKSGSFNAVAGEIWSTRGVLGHFRTIAILLQSLALSSRCIAVEDQSTANLNDRSVPQCEADAKASKTSWTWQPSDNLVKVVRTRRIPKVIGEVQYWRKRNHALRSHRSWKTWLFSCTSWTVTERQTLGSSSECWWAPETSMH